MDPVVEIKMRSYNVAVLVKEQYRFNPEVEREARALLARAAEKQTGGLVTPGNLELKWTRNEDEVNTGDWRCSASGYALVSTSCSVPRDAP